jgi:hypothetical protein
MDLPEVIARSAADLAFRRFLAAAQAQAPAITVDLSAALVAKFNDPAYRVPASERWIPAVQQVLENQKQQSQAIAELGADLQKVLAAVAALQELLPKKPGPAVRGAISFHLEGPMPQMKFAFPDNKTAVGTLDLADALNVQGASVDAPPTWSADQPFVTLTPAADGLSCTFAVDPTQNPVAGDINVTVAATAAGNAVDVDPGVLTLQAGPATTGEIVFATE